MENLDYDRYHQRARIDCYFKKKDKFSKLPRDLQQAAVRLYAISSGQMGSGDDNRESAEVLEKNSMLNLFSLVQSEIQAPVLSAMESRPCDEGFEKELEERCSELKGIRDKSLETLCARHCLPHAEFIALRNWGGNIDKDTFDSVVKGYLSYVLTKVN